MRLLISLVSFLLTLIGCDPKPGITTLTVSSVDGVKINVAQTTIANGVARFECLHSASGRCHYVVFTSNCASSAARDEQATAHCSAKVLQRFELKAGATRAVGDLPDQATWCVDHESLPVAPGCRNS